MTDLSQFSDSDLLKAAGKISNDNSVAKITSSSNASDFSKMSDADLIKAASMNLLPTSRPSASRTILDQSLQGIPLTGTFSDEVAGTAGGWGAKLYDKIMQKHLFDDEDFGDVARAGRDIAGQNIKNELQDHPAISIGSQLASGLATGGLASTTKAGQILTNSLRGGNILTRAGARAVAGAASGAAYGAGAADEGQRTEGAEYGAVLGGGVSTLAPIVGAAINTGIDATKNAWNGRFSKVVDNLQMLHDSIKDYSQKNYQIMKDANATISPEGGQAIISNINKALSDSGRTTSTLHGDTLSALEDLKNEAQSGNLTLEGLDQYRQSFRDVINKNSSKIDGMKPDALKASNAINAIDDTVNALIDKDLLAVPTFNKEKLNDAIDEYSNLKQLQNHLQNSVKGKVQFANQQGGFWKRETITNAADDAKNLDNVKQQVISQENLIKQLEAERDAAPAMIQKNADAKDALIQARAAWSAKSRIQKVQDIIINASYTDNPATAIKAGFRSWVKNKNAMQGSTPEEEALIEKAATTGKIGDVMRTVLGSRLISPSLGATMGAVSGGAPGVILGGMAGAGEAALSRNLSASIARGKALNLAKQIATRVPNMVPVSNMKIAIPTSLPSGNKSALYAAQLNNQ